MPLLFCLCLYDVFAQVQEHLQEGEVILAFLDDVARCPFPNNPGTSTISSLRSCTTWQGFVCMLVSWNRASEPERWRIWGHQCGVLKGRQPPRTLSQGCILSSGAREDFGKNLPLQNVMFRTNITSALDEQSRSLGIWIASKPWGPVSH